MREILFRGKRIDNGEWIEGCLVIRKDTGNNAINCYIIRPSYVHFNNSHIVHTEVDPDTVCEFTGLLDKNGKKIFEGDLLKDSKGQVGKVFYANGSFSVLWKMVDGSYDTDNCFGYGEVIGNKFDNPELVVEV